ncbi:MAG: hypothetical protein ABSG81_04035 [Acidimicrobiales bacterium]
MIALWRRTAAAAVTVALLTLAACDLWVGSFRAWWNAHTLDASIVSSLLVVGVTALVVDELIARRQRNERAMSVAVQALIVYGQTHRAYDATTAQLRSEPVSDVADDLRSLGNMLLTASVSFFDDPVARQFLEQVERLMGSMLRALSSAGGDGGPDPAVTEHLTADMARLKTIATPLLARIPLAEWPMVDRPAGTGPE